MSETSPVLGLKESCEDYGFARKSEPWEHSEGGIYLLRELSAVAPDRAAKFLPMLVDLVNFQFSHSPSSHNFLGPLYAKVHGS